MINWKFLPLLACAVSLFVPLTALAQRKPKIIMVTHGQAADSFWLIVRNGAEAAAAETNSDLEYRSPEKFDLTAMAQLIDEAVASKPDGLIVSIPDASCFEPIDSGRGGGENPGDFNQFGIGSLKAARMPDAHRPTGRIRREEGRGTHEGGGSEKCRHPESGSRQPGAGSAN